MKNRKLLLCGMGMLFLFLNILFTSCQKEVLPVDTSQTLTDNSTVAALDDATVTTAAALTTITSGTRNNLLFDYTSEKSDALTKEYCSVTPSNYWCSIQGYASYSIQKSTTYTRAGSYSTRYELRKTDGDVAGSKRAETNRYTKSEPVPSCERWYGASYYLPSDFATDPAAEILTQWFQLSGAHPVLSLWTINGQWRIVKFGDYNTSTVLGTYEKNKWTDFVFHVKWSSGSGGLVEIWKNGTKIYTKTGATLYSGLSYGPFFKTGIYKWPWKSTAAAQSTTTKRIVYIDEVRVGNELATYDDVKPGL